MTGSNDPTITWEEIFDTLEDTVTVMDKRIKHLEDALQEIARFPTTTPFKPTCDPHIKMKAIANRALEGK